MFLFKKIVSQFFFPLPLSLLFCFIGIYLLWLTKKQKTGKVFVTLGISLIALFSFNPVGNALLSPLENQYKVQSGITNAEIKYVVVLGGGHTSDTRLSVTSQASNSTLKRLIEGILLYRANRGCKLVLSGGSWLDSDSDAQIMAEVAKGLGVFAPDIIIESKSKDTQDQVVLLKSTLHTNKFFLVTSASHMPRSMALFQNPGQRPIAIPADHLVESPNLRDPGFYFPCGKFLRKSESAVYEYLGLVWAKLNGAKCFPI